MKCLKIIRTNLVYLWFLVGLTMLLGSTSMVNAQGFCTTDAYSENSSFEPLIQLQNESNYSGDPLHLRIYVHVIRNSNGVGGQTQQNVQDALAFLDEDFNSHGIFFVWDCHINYIDDDDWFVGPKTNPTGIFSVDNHTDGIDIYLFSADANSNGGRANGVGSSSEFWVSGTWPTGSIPVAQSHIISHEMGHVLNLWHTHHGCESGDWENTDGSNCITAGDFVCDTPADPHLSFNVNTTTCVWDGNNSGWCKPAPEPLSAYTPDTQIIMAYTAPQCMSYFTAGQGLRMRSSIIVLPYLLPVQTTPSPTDCCLEDLDLTGTEVATVEYAASNEITSTQVISPSADVSYTAGNKISLLPGFKAQQGCTFNASIGSCTEVYKTNGGGLPDIKGKPRLSLKLDDSASQLVATPNPMQSSTTFSFQLDQESETDLAVFDLTGRRVKQIVQGKLDKGTHQFVWEPEGLSAGIYMARLLAGNKVQTTRVVLVNSK